MTFQLTSVGTMFVVVYVLTARAHTHTHTHTYIYIYIYIYITFEILFLLEREPKHFTQCEQSRTT